MWTRYLPQQPFFGQTHGFCVYGTKFDNIRKPNEAETNYLKNLDILPKHSGHKKTVDNSSHLFTYQNTLFDCSHLLYEKIADYMQDEKLFRR